MPATLTRKRSTRRRTGRRVPADRVKALLTELAYQLHATKVIAKAGRG